MVGRGIWLTFAATAPQTVVGVAISRPMPTALLAGARSVALRCSTTMQYGGYGDQQQGGWGGQQQGGYGGQQGGSDQQGGYGGQQDGYGGQQGYGQQQGYGGQQGGWGGGGNGEPWRVVGVNGFTGSYTIKPLEQQSCGRYDMQIGSPYVSRMQCTIQVSADGSATLQSIGKRTTGWRKPGGYWTWVQKNERVPLTSGDQVALDQSNPEASVFACEQGGAGQQAGGFGQQQGYGQQQQGGQLPYGWEALTDPSSGQVYYSNQQTGQVQWERPQY